MNIREILQDETTDRIDDMYQVQFSHRKNNNEIYKLEYMGLNMDAKNEITVFDFMNCKCYIYSYLLKEEDILNNCPLKMVGIELYKNGKMNGTIYVHLINNNIKELSQLKTEKVDPIFSQKDLSRLKAEERVPFAKQKDIINCNEFAGYINIDCEFKEKIRIKEKIEYPGNDKLINSLILILGDEKICDKIY